MIVIPKKEIEQISQQIIQDAVKDAYMLMAKGEFNMPDRQHVSDKENTLLLMPCFSNDYFVTKLVSLFPGASEFGQPSISGIVVLNDNKTGQPLAIIDGAALTAQRTGAVGGLAIRYMTPETLETAGLIGAGVQGYHQARYLCFNRKIKTLYIYDLVKKNAVAIMEQLKKEIDEVSFHICSDPIELVQSSGAVIAATTSYSPLFDAAPDQLSGKTFISIGSFQPEMREFPDTVIETSDAVFADTLFACKESGDLAIPIKAKKLDKNVVTPFSDIFEKPVKSGQTLFFKSVGMALFDLMTAVRVFELAKKNGLGTQIEI